MSLRVLEPGLYSLVVDLGRPQQRSRGVPVGGAADRTAFQLGNALVGNPPATAALEITLAGPTLQAEAGLAGVVFGAPFEVNCGNHVIAPGHTFNLRAGDVLRIGGTALDSRAYLCLRGGLQTVPILASRSALGPIKAGDLLPCPAGTISGRFLQVKWDWDEGEQFLQTIWGPRPPFQVLRTLPGAQADWFDANALTGTPDQFGQRLFRVTPASNRMGLRLQGEPIRLPERELVSEPVCPGSVQVTRDGQCIILGVDGQTIGGYPKIAQVISADLDKLGQLRPGDSICFVSVSLEEAERLYFRKQEELMEWLLRLQVTQLGP